MLPLMSNPSPVSPHPPLPATAAAVGLQIATGALQGDPVVRIQRTVGELRGVFANEAARTQLSQETIAYRVDCYFPVPEGTEGGLFFGATFLEPGLVGDEYFITKGHFHAKIDTAEYYWCLRGEGILLLMDEQRRCRAERMAPGTLHYIPGRIAHRVANIGDETLCFGACWPADAGHDYESIAARGFSARVISTADGPVVVPAEEPST
jgi:glucose-6-phosphate isomerase